MRLALLILGLVCLFGASATSGEEARRIEGSRDLLKLTVRQQVGKKGIERGGERAVRGGAEDGRTEGGRERRLGNAGRSDEQFLHVLDGESALIAVGREIPFTREIGLLAGRHRALSRAVEYRQVGTGFRVRPRLQGEEVLLEIAPAMTALSSEGEDELDFHHLVTTVRIPLGQWYNLAGHLSRGDEVSRAVLTLRAGGEREERELWIKVER